MFTDTLEIGTKDYSVEVPVQLAESTTDCATLSKDNSDYVVACFNRAHRINLQERSGARDFVSKAIAGKASGVINSPEFKAQLVSDLTALLAAWVPGARRQVVREAPVVKVAAGTKSMTLEQLQAMLANAGVKLEIGG